MAATASRFERPDQAVVPATDHGLVVGDGVFEALKATPAGAFAVQRHLDRLSRSAAAMGLPAPDHGLVREGIAAALDGWPLPEAKVRITYTGGEGPLGSGRRVRAADPDRRRRAPRPDARRPPPSSPRRGGGTRTAR